MFRCANFLIEILFCVEFDVYLLEFIQYFDLGIGKGSPVHPQVMDRRYPLNAGL
jgi:hypothetical protein